MSRLQSVQIQVILIISYYADALHTSFPLELQKGYNLYNLDQAHCRQKGSSTLPFGSLVNEYESQVLNQKQLLSKTAAVVPSEQADGVRLLF